jgi:hypothetical protein
MSGDGSFARDASTQTWKAAVLIVAVVLVGWAVLKHGHSSPSSGVGTASTHSTTTVHAGGGTTVPATTTTTAPIIAPASIKLQVLNGVLTGSVAGQWSQKLKITYNYNTLAPDNATAKVTVSAIYVVKTGYVPEANVLAVSVGLTSANIHPTPTGAPVRPAELANADLILVIGPDLASKA